MERSHLFLESSSSCSCHGDDRRMLRIISPLGRDSTSDRDPHHHGNGCRGWSCSWTKWKSWRNPSTPRCRRRSIHAKRANTNNTRKYNGQRTQSVHQVRMSPFNKIVCDKVHEAYQDDIDWYAKHSLGNYHGAQSNKFYHCAK